MSYDQIAARLICPRCGLETREEQAQFQMRWSFPAECTTYRPGDRLNIKNPKYWSYYNMRGDIDLDSTERLRILDPGEAHEVAARVSGFVSRRLTSNSAPTTPTTSAG